MASQLLRRGKPRERVQTDKSLRFERRKADRELEKRVAKSAEAADKVVRTARERAAAVLAEARWRTDKGSADPSARNRVRIRRAQVRADGELQRQYSTADARLERERATRIRVLAKLFLAERQLTDERLLTERTRSDQLVTARDELLAQVSHDLRGFLGAIALRTEFLQYSIPKDPESPITEAILAIKELAATMGRLIGDLLDAASVESGTFRIKKDHARLDQILLVSADAFREAAAGKRISLTVATAECPPVRFDHQRILQVLANLVGNAIKFTPTGGRIAIRLEGADGQCQVSVADTGSGIPEGKLESIFDRFAQGRRGDRRGLGLGLFIVRTIVEAHGGMAWAESTLGRGSTFYFTLPAARSRRRRPGRPGMRTAG